MSFNGRTGGFEPPNEGSIPSAPANLVCGEDFCDYCGDCLVCYGEDPCYAADPEGNERHMYVPNDGDNGA